MKNFTDSKNNLTFFDKLKSLNLVIIVLIVLLAVIGFIMLYSVSGGSADPWMRQQILRFGFGFCIMTVKHLITHSGGFHADELLSSVVLTRLSALGVSLVTFPVFRDRRG